VSETRQRWLRQMMGLGPAPDPTGLRLVDGKVRWLTGAQREIELAAWHREGRRARVAAHLAYLPQGSTGGAAVSRTVPRRCCR